MKFEFIPRTRESPNSTYDWGDILLKRRLLAAAESSSSAATGRPRDTVDIRDLADPALALAKRQTSRYIPDYSQKTGPIY